ncbi:SDR family oxidoreductase [Vineibacter terrae]|uniref:SDR family oxidoreductase n=1 Tax=Vineibacter terrae TaxID=2586908 RepID=UPI002E2F00F9|nr:SDR family oxidoreductase [Vineibacter terrae]HEX2890678.1 SDR family oxidoreductase [Vineibacter terrae]
MNEAGKSRVLVVGGTRGTGLLIARLLHARNYRVRVLARDPARASAELGSAFEVVAGDLTKASTLPPALRAVDHIIFTAGAPSGRYASERLVKATDHDGVLDTLAAAHRAEFRGRFVYLNTIGIHTPSVARTLLNLLKRNTFVWRRRVEDEIRSSGLDYTIIRVGFLVDRPAREHAVVVGQGDLPLAPRNRIARADVAEAFVEAMQHPRASRATFEIVWGDGPRRESWDELLGRLRPEAGGEAEDKLRR